MKFLQVIYESLDCDLTQESFISAFSQKNKTSKMCIDGVLCGCVCVNGVSVLFLSCFSGYSLFHFLLQSLPSISHFFAGMLLHSPDSLLEFIELLLVLSSRLLSSLCFDSAGIYRGTCPIWWFPGLMAGSGSMVLPVAY